MSFQTTERRQGIFRVSGTLKLSLSISQALLYVLTNYSRGISSGNIKENYTQSKAKAKAKAKAKERKKDSERERYKKQFKMMKTKR